MAEIGLEMRFLVRRKKLMDELNRRMTSQFRGASKQKNVVTHKADEIPARPIIFVENNTVVWL
jgi:hypothetical protein